MDPKLKRRETWTLITAGVGFLGGVAIAIASHFGVEPQVEPLVALFTASVTAMGVGSATQVKRAQQRGEQAGVDALTIYNAAREAVAREGVKQPTAPVQAATGTVRNDIPTYVPPEPTLTPEQVAARNAAAADAARAQLAQASLDGPVAARTRQQGDA